MEELSSSSITLAFDEPLSMAFIVFLLVVAFLFLLGGLIIGFRQGRNRERAEWEGHKMEGIIK